MVPKGNIFTYVDFCKTKSIFWTCSKHLIIQECIVMSAKIEVPLSLSTAFLLKHPSFKPASISYKLFASDTVRCTIKLLKRKCPCINRGFFDFMFLQYILNT